ncbi:hypothetical protein [Parasphingorhabdus sp.]|uniref:hypothetical protein n=1 Tax=Parasphingorhabdus sp. TaxID=2709688 RepID=UPI003BAE35E6
MNQAVFLDPDTEKSDNLCMTAKKTHPDSIAGIQRDLPTSSLSKMMEDYGINRDIALRKAIGGYGATEMAITRAQFQTPLADVMKQFGTPNIGKELLESGIFGNMQKTNFSAFSGIDMDELFGLTTWQKQLADMNKGVLGLVAGQNSDLQKALETVKGNLFSSGILDIGKLDPLSEKAREHLDTIMGRIPSLGLTNDKFAALAGIGDVYGIGKLHSAMTRSILGGWHTNVDLPKPYWRDIDSRRDFYRDADVDEGLVEGDAETIMELGISCGVVSGKIEEEKASWTFSIGSTIVSVSSPNISGDTFNLVGSIELAIRRFIISKMEEKFGPRWFKQRVAGEIFAKAKKTREQALKGNEPNSPLIHFITLGELMEIILRKDNWSDIFEPVFRDRDWFKRDMGVLLLARNPNSHFRVNDPVRLTEAAIVTQRLNDQMRDDGKWLDDASNEV